MHTRDATIPELLNYMSWIVILRCHKSRQPISGLATLIYALIHSCSPFSCYLATYYMQWYALLRVFYVTTIAASLIHIHTQLYGWFKSFAVYYFKGVLINFNVSSIFPILASCIVHPQNFLAYSLFLPNRSCLQFSHTAGLGPVSYMVKNHKEY